MQTGTQILLERMKTNPEEFPSEGEIAGKWSAIMRDAMNYLPKEDREALDIAYRQVQVDRYNERVLRRLTGEEDNREGVTLKYQAKERYAAGWSDARGVFGNAVVKAEGQVVNYDADGRRINYDHNTDTFRYATVEEHIKEHREFLLQSIGGSND